MRITESALRNIIRQEVRSIVSEAKKKKVTKADLTLLLNDLLPIVKKSVDKELNTYGPDEADLTGILFDALEKVRGHEPAKKLLNAILEDSFDEMSDLERSLIAITKGDRRVTTSKLASALMDYAIDREIEVGDSESSYYDSSSLNSDEIDLDPSQNVSLGKDVDDSLDGLARDVMYVFSYYYALNKGKGSTAAAAKKAFSEIMAGAGEGYDNQSGEGYRWSRRTPAGTTALRIFEEYYKHLGNAGLESALVSIMAPIFKNTKKGWVPNLDDWSGQVQKLVNNMMSSPAAAALQNPR